MEGTWSSLAASFLVSLLAAPSTQDLPLPAVPVSGGLLHCPPRPYPATAVGLGRDQPERCHHLPGSTAFASG